MKNITKILSWAVALLLLSLAGVLLLSKFNNPLGIRVFTVLSGSMEPTIPTGSVVISQARSNYEEGEIVTVRSKPGAKVETITHRITKKQVDEDTNITVYELKGDANEEVDNELINKNRVIGEVIITIPGLGRVINFAQSQLGFILLLVIPGTYIIFSETQTIKKEVGELLKQRKEKRKPAHQPVETKHDEV